MDATMDKVQYLPGSVGILVVDVERFSAHNDVQQRRIETAIPDALKEAADLCGIPEIWGKRRFPTSTGDGYVIGIDEVLLPHVVHGYLTSLQAVLRELNEKLRGDGIVVRMRLSLNTGPITMLDDLRLTGHQGTTVVDAHRLVDCQQLRTLLKKSDPTVTYLVAAIAEPVITKVVRTGYAARAESEYVKTSVEIAAKDYNGVAYLHVPTLSGEILANGLLGIQESIEPDEEKVAPSEERAPAPAQSTGDTEGVAVNAGGSVSGSTIGREIDNSQRVDNSSHGQTVDNSQWMDRSAVNHATNNHVGGDVNQSADVVNGEKYAPTNSRGRFGRFGSKDGER